MGFEVFEGEWIMYTIGGMVGVLRGDDLEIGEIWKEVSCAVFNG